MVLVIDVLQHQKNGLSIRLVCRVADSTENIVPSKVQCTNVYRVRVCVAEQNEKTLKTMRIPNVYA